MGTLAAGMKRETRNQRVTVAMRVEGKGGWEGQKDMASGNFTGAPGRRMFLLIRGQLTPLIPMLGESPERPAC